MAIKILQQKKTEKHVYTNFGLYTFFEVKSSYEAEGRLGKMHNERKHKQNNTVFISHARAQKLPDIKNGLSISTCARSCVK